VTTSKLSTSSLQCRRTSSIAFASTASDVPHARLYCLLDGSAPNRRAASPPALRATFLYTNSVTASPPCTSLLCIAPPPFSVVGHALASALPCLSCALLCSAAHALLYPCARICHTLADSLCPRSNRAALHRRFPPSGSLQRPPRMFRPTPAHTVILRAPSHARSRHPLGVAHIRSCTASRAVHEFASHPHAASLLGTRASAPGPSRVHFLRDMCLHSPARTRSLPCTSTPPAHAPRFCCRACPSRITCSRLHLVCSRAARQRLACLRCAAPTAAAAHLLSGPSHCRQPPDRALPAAQRSLRLPAHAREAAAPAPASAATAPSRPPCTRARHSPGAAAPCACTPPSAGPPAPAVHRPTQHLAPRRLACLGAAPPVRPRCCLTRLPAPPGAWGQALRSASWACCCVTVRVFVMLGIYFVSVKYMFVCI
jgi:hypothetical protein